MAAADQAPPPPAGPQPATAPLVVEAVRQLQICNACRYCEGLCAVFPALERRNLLVAEDVSQLANLCHDCRACFDACMYTAPHEFDVNLPVALSRVRLSDYRRHVWPSRVPRLFTGWAGVFSGGLLVSAVLVVIVLLHAGPGGLVASSGRPMSPYTLVPHGVLLALTLLCTAYPLVVAAIAGRRYWAEVNAPAPMRPTVRAVLRAVWHGLTLRQLRGGGAECYYPEDDQPEPSRRLLHYTVVIGFGLCLVSTSAASVLQNLLGREPPYDWLSVPVLTGTAGGVLLTVGSIGLFALKTRSSAVTGVAGMTVKDYGLIVALAFLGISGLATLLVRTTPAYGIVLLVHLASVLLAFLAAPYSKFIHVVFRFLALVRDGVEQTARHGAR